MMLYVQIQRTRRNETDSVNVVITYFRSTISSPRPISHDDITFATLLCCCSDYSFGMYSLYSVDCVDNDVVQNYNFVDHVLKMVSNDPSLQNMTALLRSFLPCPPERMMLTLARPQHQHSR